MVQQFLKRMENPRLPVGNKHKLTRREDFKHRESRTGFGRGKAKITPAV